MSHLMRMRAETHHARRVPPNRPLHDGDKLASFG